MAQTDKGATLCKYHMHGACTRGASCPFSHDLHELPNSICTHWLKGQCAYGTKCRYAHSHPEWAPRREVDNSCYKPPPIVKPETNSLEDQLPISKLRLSGKAVLPPTTSTSTLGALLAEERRSPLPIELPADPFGAGEDSSTEHEARIAALILDDGIDALPDDLGIGSNAVLPLEHHIDALRHENNTESNPYQWNESNGHHQVDDEVFAAGVYHFGGDMAGLLVEGSTGTEMYPRNSDAAAYDEGEAAYEQERYEEGVEYYEGDTGAYGSANGNTSAGGFGSHGEHGLYGASSGPASSGTSPHQNHHFGAWHIPGGGSDGGWGNNGVDISRFYSNPGLQSLCYEYYSSGTCSQGEGCHLAHGDLCETCQHYALHPMDAAAREAHTHECNARHERLLARARSSHVECGICFERVLEKVNGDRKFGLLECEHSFCLSCIRSWRQNLASGADVESALRTCPMCRVPTHFITPSTIWPGTPEEKDAITAGYKAKLASIDCRHFNFGEGTCPFGTSCMYRHGYPDGRLEEAAPRRVVADEGEVRFVQQPTLYDFIKERKPPKGRRRGGS